MKLSLFDLLTEDHGDSEEQKILKYTNALRKIADEVEMNVKSGHYKEASNAASMASKAQMMIQQCLKTHMKSISSGQKPPMSNPPTNNNSGNSSMY